MAITLEQIRGKILTSIHGRRLGLDANDHLVGPKSLRQQVTQATSATTGTAIDNYGLTLMAMTTAAAKTYTLNAPEAGVSKELVATSSSTLVTKITLSNASLSSTAGSSTTSITFNGRGDRAILVGLSTSQWAAVYLNGAST
jgi:hypothetical protein